MLAHTGHWNTEHYIRVERKRLEAERAIYAERRRKHRSLERRERLLRDLEAIDKKLKVLLKTVEHRKQLPGVPKYGARVVTLLRRRNRIVDALNAYVGTSQRVAPEEV